MLHKKIKPLTLLLASSVLAIPSTSIAGADSGFYIGGGTGNATVETTGFDESDTAYKAFGGYNIGFIPLVDFAVEASYVDFGSPGNTASGNIDITGFDAFGLAGLSFGPFGVFAKMGTISWDSDASVGSSDSGTDPAYGIGVRFSVASFAVRAEYEVFDLDEIDIDMVSVSAVITF